MWRVQLRKVSEFKRGGGGCPFEFPWCGMAMVVAVVRLFLLVAAAGPSMMLALLK
jgi:hypothetical protein